jgi:pyrophosphatase PpaX
VLKAVIFDVDGVLVDSKDANVQLFQDLLTGAGYPKPSREEILACFHTPLIPTLQKLTGTEDKKVIQSMVDRLNEPGFRNEPADELFKFPQELEEVLEELHGKYKLAIVTSRMKVGVDHIFNLREIKHFFDVVVAYEDYKNPKPHPEPLQVAIKKLGVEPSEAVYIGDGHSDIEAALAAGLHSIHLSTDQHEGATAGAEEFHELLAAIKSLI